MAREFNKQKEALRVKLPRTVREGLVKRLGKELKD